MVSSCGIFRKVDKTVNKSESEGVVIERSDAQEKETVTDKTTIKTTETIDGEAKSPKKEVTVKTPLDKLKDGNEVVTMDSTGLIMVSILLDSLNNIITNVTKKEETLFVPNAGTRITEEQRDIIIQRDRGEAILRKEKTKQETYNKDVKKEPKNAFLGVVMWIVAGAISIYIIYKVIKIKKWL